MSCALSTKTPYVELMPPLSGATIGERFTGVDMVKYFSNLKEVVHFSCM